MFGVWDPPTTPFGNGRFLPVVPQTDVDRAFAREDLSAGCQNGTYQEVTRDYVLKKVEAAMFPRLLSIGSKGKVALSSIC